MADEQTDDAHFEFLLRRVLDSLATEEERRAFSGLLRDRSDRMARYVGHLEVIAAALCLGNGFLQVSCPPRHSIKWLALGLKAAAAVLAVLFIEAAWYAESRRVWLAKDTCVRSVFRTSGPSSTLVRLVRTKNVVGLNLPCADVDGQWYRIDNLQMEQGVAAFRLVSGVEITLIGPVGLTFKDGMEVSLICGSLLASVPPEASGFTVHAPGLTAWDMGTLFGVSTHAETSDLFVFKGSVQVNDAAGDGVGLCEAGEGVRAMLGKRAMKLAADWTEARNLFASVAGKQALVKPEKTIGVLQRLTDLWMAKYDPRVAPLTIAQAASSAKKRIPFSKKAWVRPCAPLQEEETMNKTSAAVLVATALSAGTALAVSAPVSVDAFPCRDNRHWTTVYTNAVPLRWNWNADAARAQLAIVGMNTTIVKNFAVVTSNWVWQAFSSDVPKAEDAYALTLTFYTADDVVVESMTSRVAVVKGAFGEASVDPSLEESAAWRKVTENVVIPYDAGWTEATADAANSLLVITKEGGATQTNALSDASGYFGWKLRRSNWGYGTFDLSLTFPETAANGWDAVLKRVPDGIIISVR